MGSKTPLYESHVAMNGKIVDFGGWDMPLNYGSQIDEHNTVRTAAGMFDVSHMTVVDYRGTGVRAFLRYLLANDINKLTESGKALYSCMLKTDGGVIDDLITYFINDNHYRMVVNASTREKDLAWINTQAANFDVAVTERPELAMIAVQGPQAREKAHSVLPVDVAASAAKLDVFFAEYADINGSEWFIARTGYTGEDGYEIVLPAEQAAGFWQQLADAGVKPAGLGARDTLRLEAGMNLYGSDMDETTSPLGTGLSWTVAWQPEDRDFIGRAALETEKAAGVATKRVGLVLEGKGVLRNHMKVVVEGVGEGEITSGAFSPTLSKGFGMARVPAGTGDTCQIEVRGKLLDARVVKLPFVRNGESLV